ncbi:MAG: radical SAM protein [Candidatus Omnitrophica bacterium]|nr:radical SAM protein [Candidatus Omnitrophota bacterium]MDD5736837.1 radical SAM protein [Candidatus Omnitrophota bacterium]
MRILLVSYDNGSYVHFFPQGLGYIAAALKKEGHQVAIYSQDYNHYPDEHLTSHLDRNSYDIVGVSIIAGYYQYRKLLKISDAINKSKNRPFYILGGHGPSPEPEYFLRKTSADAAVIGEGEATINELVSAIGGRKPLGGIKGIAFRSGDTVTVNERRPLIEDVDNLPMPEYGLFPMGYYRMLRMPHAQSNDLVMPLLSGRGCTFECTFCYRMDKGFRPRSSESIIDEIKFLKEQYGVTYIAFSDELLMSSVERTVMLCESFIKKDLGIKWWCNGRLNYARPEVLGLMKRSGCVFINYGIEAMDNHVLKMMKKGLTTDMIIKGIEATLKAEISPGLNIMFGNIGDNKDTMGKAVEFLLKYDDHAQLRTIRPVTPYPGSPLYYYAIEKGLLKDCADFYENKHVNSDLPSVNFTDLSEQEYLGCLLDANKRLIKEYYGRKLSDSMDQVNKLYLEKDANFRGFRQT